MPLNLPETSSGQPDDANTLKRRLLGAAVLIALAVIFLPLLLDGSGSESRFRRVEQLRTEPPRIIGSDGQVEQQSQPATPVVTQTPSVQAQKPVDVEPKPTPSVSPEPAPVETIVEETPEPAAKPPVKAEAAAPAPKPVEQAAKTQPRQQASSQITELSAWVVQAGSFSDEINALSLRDKLRAAGYPSFVSLADKAGAPLYRVKVGPVTDRLKAENNQREIERLIGQQALIRQYP